MFCQSNSVHYLHDNSSELRLQAVEKAIGALEEGGLLCIVTPDSCHQVPYCMFCLFKMFLSVWEYEMLNNYLDSSSVSGSKLWAAFLMEAGPWSVGFGKGGFLPMVRFLGWFFSNWPLMITQPRWDSAGCDLGDLHQGKAFPWSYLQVLFLFVTLFHKQCFSNLLWIHGKTIEVEDCELVPVLHPRKFLNIIWPFSGNQVVS